MALWHYCVSALANNSPLNHHNSALCTKKAAESAENISGMKRNQNI